MARPRCNRVQMVEVVLFLSVFYVEVDIWSGRWQGLSDMMLISHRAVFSSSVKLQEFISADSSYVNVFWHTILCIYDQV